MVVLMPEGSDTGTVRETTFCRECDNETIGGGLCMECEHER